MALIDSASATRSEAQDQGSSSTGEVCPLSVVEDGGVVLSISGLGMGCDNSMEGTWIGGKLDSRWLCCCTFRKGCTLGLAFLSIGGPPRPPGARASSLVTRRLKYHRRNESNVHSHFA